KAVILTAHPRHRREAIALWEQGPAQQRSIQDQWRLLELLEAEQDVPRIRELNPRLWASNAATPSHAAICAPKSLLRGELSLARAWLTQMERRFPNALPTVEIQARVLHAQGQRDRAVLLIKDFIRGKPVEEPGTVAGLLEDLGELAAPEELYRQSLSRS